jgi:hypothetical protein
MNWDNVMSAVTCHTLNGSGLRDFLLSNTIQNDSGNHPAYYSVDIIFLPGGKAASA